MFPAFERGGIFGQGQCILLNVFYLPFRAPGPVKDASREQKIMELIEISA